MKQWKSYTRVKLTQEVVDEGRDALLATNFSLRVQEFVDGIYEIL